MELPEQLREEAVPAHCGGLVPSGAMTEPSRPTVVVADRSGTVTHPHELPEIVRISICDASHRPVVPQLA